MVKKIVIGAALLIVIIGGGLAYVWSNLDGYIRTAIEKYGTAATQTAVNLDSVSLSLASGEGSLSGLSVDNPKNFNTSVKAIYLGSIEMKIDTKSIQGNGPIIIREITIQKPQVNYEITNAGDSNLSVIQHNAVAYANSMNGTEDDKPAPAPAANSPKSGDKGNGRKVIITNLYVRNGQVGISTEMLKNKNFTAPLPEIHLTNIGKNSGGATAAEVAQQLLSSITASAGTVAVSTISKNVGGLVDIDTLKGAASDSTSNMKNQMKSLFGN